MSRDTRKPRHTETPKIAAPSPFKQSADAADPRRAGCYDCSWGADRYGYTPNDKRDPRERANDHRKETGHATWVECDPAAEYAAESWRSKIEPRSGGNAPGVF